MWIETHALPSVSPFELIPFHISGASSPLSLLILADAGQHPWVEGDLPGLDLDRRPVVGRLDDVVEALEPSAERLDLGNPVGHRQVGRVRDLTRAPDLATEGVVPVTGRLLARAVRELQARDERDVRLELLQPPDGLGEGHAPTLGIDARRRVGDGDRRLEPHEVVLGLGARLALGLERELRRLAGLVRDRLGGAALMLLHGTLELLHPPQALGDGSGGGGGGGRGGGGRSGRRVHGVTSERRGVIPAVLSLGYASPNERNAG